MISYGEDIYADQTKSIFELAEHHATYYELLESTIVSFLAYFDIPIEDTYRIEGTKSSHSYHAAVLEALEISEANPMLGILETDLPNGFFSTLKDIRNVARSLRNKKKISIAWNARSSSLTSNSG